MWERACSRKLVVLEHHMPDDGVVLQPVHRHVFAITGQFLTAVGHFADQHEVRIHPGAAVPAGGQTGDARDRHPPSRPTTPGRSPNHWPSPARGFIAELCDRHHRSEHFAANNFVILLGVGQYGRLEEEAIAVHRLAAGDQTDVRLCEWRARQTRPRGRDVGR